MRIQILRKHSFVLRKHILGVLPIIIFLLIVACDNEKESPAESSTDSRICFITSEKECQTYQYNEQGDISNWTYSDSQSNKYVANYTYAEDGVIHVEAEENRSGEIWRFSEILKTDASGLVKSAEGTVTISYESYGQMRKKYDAVFEYDSFDHLTTVNVTELSDSDKEDKYPIIWSVNLEWENGRLVRNTENNSSGNVLLEKCFVYFPSAAGSYIPILDTTILRSFYLPLQYMGYMGTQSDDLLKEVYNGQSDTPFVQYSSYTFSTSLSGTRIEGYTQKYRNEMTDFSVEWENYIVK